MQQIAGYDARDYREDYEELWPTSRREQFLYRLDVKKVLSVDTEVWPTVFSAAGAAMPAHQEAVQDLWASPDALRKALSVVAQETALPALRTVAITLVEDGTERPHPSIGQVSQFVEERDLTNWQFVGFDVADGFLLSALTNCGFLPGYDDASAMRKQWAPYLNAVHLFADLAAASAFRQMSDMRLAGDHAPTFVYGIYVLPLPKG